MHKNYEPVNPFEGTFAHIIILRHFHFVSPHSPIGTFISVQQTKRNRHMEITIFALQEWVKTNLEILKDIP
jgi:hypothetical protein